jgi:ectoine hydroxylase-related dioxygenase (phytanoyl-CoA dioxygenase family)
MWVSPDVVTEESGAMQYVRGSHRWPSFFKPNAFVTQMSLDALGAGEAEEHQVALPDIEGNWFHRSAPPQPHHAHRLQNGDIIDCEQFPVVWRSTP